MTTLGRIIAARIAAEGPMLLDDYMRLCLMHPSHGYYSTRDPFGTKGDFTTAPEISQMFGELVGLALAQAWLDQGAPAPFTLAELGPGRGTLMADLLRATERAHAGDHGAVSIGSYPFFREGRVGSNFVVRSEEQALAQACIDELAAGLTAAGYEVVAGGI